MWLATAGFGAVEGASGYIELIATTKDAGLTMTRHTGGVPRFVGRSRHTPPTTRPVTVVRNTVLREF